MHVGSSAIKRTLSCQTTFEQKWVGDKRDLDSSVCLAQKVLTLTLIGRANKQRKNNKLEQKGLNTTLVEGEGVLLDVEYGEFTEGTQYPS